MTTNKRMWINTPSTLQPHHSLNGKCVIAQQETESVYRVWFTSGPYVSMLIAAQYLETGWPNEIMYPGDGD